MQTYKVTLPHVHNRYTSLVVGIRDVNVTVILNLLQPSLLESHIPISVIGDGN